MTVLIVMGVSGSGKSTIAEALAARLRWVFQEGDALHPPANIQKMHAGMALSDQDRAPWLAAVKAWIDARVATGETGLITCSALRRAYRETLVCGRPPVRLLYLKVDEAVLERRVRERTGHFMPPSLLESQLHTLEEPGPEERPIVVDVGGALEHTVQAALTLLEAGGNMAGSSVTRIAPRVEAEDLPAARLEGALALPEPAAPRRWAMPALVLTGSAVLVLGLAGLETEAFVAAQFARSPYLGGLTAGVATTGFGLIGLGFWREFAALSALSAVDKLRAALAGRDDVARASAARAWLRHLPEGPALLPAVNAVNDPDAILALLRAGPGASLRAKSEALGRAAAVQSVAGIAAMPSPGLAALFVAWRGLRLIRQVAALHGLRPGVFATLGLLRRTALSAGAVAGVEIATNTAAHALLSSPVLQHVAGEMAGAGVAARRMIVLARAASVACSPIEGSV